MRCMHAAAAHSTGAQNRVGGCYYSLVLLAFPAISAMDLVLPERQVVTREISRGFYGCVDLLVGGGGC